MKIKKNSREKSPAFQFYAGDWLNDPALRMCSWETRGVWIELLCIMFLSNEVGILKISDTVLTAKDIQKLVKISPKKFQKVWHELTTFGIIKCDENGQFYSKRMVGDERIRQVRRGVGKMGGNPKLQNKKNFGSNLVEDLVNQKSNQNPTPSSSSSSSSSYTYNNDIICSQNELCLLIQKNFPEVSKLKKQLTDDQAEKLQQQFSMDQITEVLESMENFPNIHKKYNTVFLTLRNWIKLRNNGKQQQQQTNYKIKPNFDDKIRQF